MRGPGSTTWNWLNTNYPVQYPSTPDECAEIQRRPAGVQNRPGVGLVASCRDRLGYLGGLHADDGLEQLRSHHGAFSVLPATRLIASRGYGDASSTGHTDHLQPENHHRWPVESLVQLQRRRESAERDHVAGHPAQGRDGQSSAPARATCASDSPGSTGGSTNIHEIMCFQATPDEHFAKFRRPQPEANRQGANRYPGVLRVLQPRHLGRVPDLAVSRPRCDQSQFARASIRPSTGTRPVY